MKELLKLLSVHYEVKALNIFENINTTVQQGDIIGVIGKNGAGKSTLLQLINNELLPTQGQIQRLQEDVKMVILEQEIQSFVSEDISAFEVELFEKWQVPAHDFEQLSGGEKLKARLASVFAKDAHILMLDEPTNHLDLPSREQLEDTLAQYNGTLIVVSHDRYFLKKVTNSIFIISNNSIQKQWVADSQKTNNLDEIRLKLETERQEVLGKLSYMTTKDDLYPGLDQKFKELTKQIKELHKE